MSKRPNLPKVQPLLSVRFLPDPLTQPDTTLRLALARLGVDPLRWMAIARGHDLAELLVQRTQSGAIVTMGRNGADAYAWSEVDGAGRSPESLRDSPPHRQEEVQPP